MRVTGILGILGCMIATLARSLGIIVTVFLLVACTTQPTASPSTPGPSVDPLAGGFVGHVADPDGDPIEDAVVVIEQGEFEGNTVTDEKGEFRSPGVAGDFTISVSALYFQQATRQISVPAGELVTVEFILQPSS